MEYGYYDTYTTTTTTGSGLETALGGMLLLIYFISIISSILSIVAYWKIYTKAGKPGWASIIPIYNIVILFEIVELEWWHVLIAMFVPFAIFIYLIVIDIKLAKVFGQGTGMILLLILIPVVGQLMLAFGSATYKPEVNYSMNQNNMNDMNNMPNNNVSMDNKDYSTMNVNNNDHYYNAELDHMSQKQINEMVKNNMIQEQNTNQVNNQNNVFNQVNNNDLNQNTINNQANINQMNNTINEASLNNNNLNQSSVEQSNVNQPSTKICPICGSNQALDASVCLICGNKFM